MGVRLTDHHTVEVMAAVSEDMVVRMDHHMEVTAAVMGVALGVTVHVTVAAVTAAATEVATVATAVGVMAVPTHD